MQSDKPLQICVRMPNWLGDVVMSFGFLHVLTQTYPAAKVTVIIKKGLDRLIPDKENIHSVIAFSKDEYKGLRGVWKFGNRLHRSERFDLFFVLPDSLSAAIMAYASGAKKRIGYRNEGRRFLLTDSYRKSSMHRVEEYASLLYSFNPLSRLYKPVVELLSARQRKNDCIVVNINSEAVSRRLPVEKAIALITLLQQYSLPIKLIGSGKESVYVNEVYEGLPAKNNVEILAGKTNLQELIVLIQNAILMVSSDSGPAHIASASKTPLVVLFGAGDEANTGPYRNDQAIVVRNAQLPCEPCVKNTCRLAPVPVCMMQLDLMKVIVAINKLLPTP